MQQAPQGHTAYLSPTIPAVPGQPHDMPTNFVLQPNISAMNQAYHAQYLSMVQHCVRNGHWDYVRQYADTIHEQARPYPSIYLIVLKFVSMVRQQIFLEKVERMDFVSAERELLSSLAAIIAPHATQEFRNLLRSVAFNKSTWAQYKQDTFRLPPNQSICVLRESLAMEISRELVYAVQYLHNPASYTEEALAKAQVQVQAQAHTQPIVQYIPQIPQHGIPQPVQLQGMAPSAADAIPFKKRLDTSPQLATLSPYVRAVRPPPIRIDSKSSSSPRRSDGRIAKKRRGNNGTQRHLNFENDDFNLQDTHGHQASDSSIFVRERDAIRTGSPEECPFKTSSVTRRPQVSFFQGEPESRSSTDSSSEEEDGDEYHPIESEPVEEEDIQDNQSTRKRNKKRREVPAEDQDDQDSDSEDMSRFKESVRSTSQPHSKLAMEGVASTPAIRKRIREMAFEKKDNDITWGHILKNVTGNRAKIWMAVYRFVDHGLLIQSGKGRRNHPYRYRVPEEVTESDFIRLEPEFQNIDVIAKKVRLQMRLEEKRKAIRE